MCVCVCVCGICVSCVKFSSFVPLLNSLDSDGFFSPNDESEDDEETIEKEEKLAETVCALCYSLWSFVLVSIVCSARSIISWDMSYGGILKPKFRRKVCYVEQYLQKHLKKPPLSALLWLLQ